MDIVTVSAVVILGVTIGMAGVALLIKLFLYYF